MQDIRETGAKNRRKAEIPFDDGGSRPQHIWPGNRPIRKPCESGFSDDKENKMNLRAYILATIWAGLCGLSLGVFHGAEVGIPVCGALMLVVNLADGACEAIAHSKGDSNADK